jgi:hypothetical protein
VSEFAPQEIEAWHEAGHAVVARLLGGRVRSLTLDAEEEIFGGRAEIEWPDGSPTEVASLSARAALGGPLAEIERFGGEALDDPHVFSAWSADWGEVERCAAEVETDEAERLALVKSWVAEVRTMISTPNVEERIARVADALDAHGTLDEDLFEDCLA